MAIHYIVGIIVGLLIAWKVPTRQYVSDIASAFRTVAARLRSLATPAPKAQPEATEHDAAPAAHAADTASDTSGSDVAVGARLSELQGEFESRLESLVHSREFWANDQFREAVNLLADPKVPLDTVVTYAIGQSWGLSCAALAALEKRDDREAGLKPVMGNFDRLVPFAFHFAFGYFQSLEERPAVGEFLLHARDWWSNNTLITILIKEYFQRAQELGDAVEFGPELARTEIEKHTAINSILERVQHPWSQILRERLQEHQRSTVDEAFLTGFGRFWRQKKDLEAAVEPADWSDALTSTEATAREEPVRSLLVSGEHRVGKTTFLLLLAKRLEQEGWLVFEASGADLMAGQKWFGELEGRIQRTITELATSKKLIWYIPDLLQVALSGTHQGQSASILDQILPAVTAGRLIIWTETSASGMARLLRLSPGLRSAFEAVRLEPMHIEDATVLAHQVSAKLAGDMTIDAAAVETAITSARQYLSTASMPGAALDLIKQTTARLAKSKTRHIAPHDVIVTLSQQTGLPTSILDNTERLDLSTMRAHFSSRVIGQEEAVNAVVERIAMLKAGLNDMTKPIGVLLFAGSTGTGKTELAKTLAEYLFGSIERMIRLDMSEFQTPESTAKILGSGGERGPETDSLITRVRKQPFSVVLLDEFEKAHPNVWDLFLQVFDDGRLTDAAGQVADFRHCIVIMTTNLGATSHHSSGLGFARSEDAFTTEQIMRAVGQTFRPEFQNRIDKIIVFRPLTRELMRGILKKELASLLDRRGFKDREWAVEWEASALEFLLEKGFTPEMGARPLKRAIDQYVLAPIAATIVERRFPEGDQFVFVRSDGKAIQAEFVDPDMDIEAPVPSAQARRDDIEAAALPPLAGIILSAKGTTDEQHALAAGMQEIETTLASPAWEKLQSDGLERMRETDFWSRPDRHETLAQIALMDRVKAAADTAFSLQARQAKGSERAGRSSRELIQRLALQIHLVKEGIADVVAAAPIEVAVVVEPTLSRPGLGDDDGIAWCVKVLNMYRTWAKSRNMQLSELSNSPQRRLPWLLISGFGAHRVLTQEIGLHVLEQEDAGTTDRYTAKVRVVAAPLGDVPQDRLRAQIRTRLEALPGSLAIIRRYREAPSPLVRQMTGPTWRSGRLDAVLAGNFDLIPLAQKASD